MLKYKLIQRKNLKTKVMEYHPILEACTPVERRQLFDEIAEECTVTSADIKAVIDRLENKVVQHLLDGKSIRLGDLGSFHLTLLSKGDTDKKKVGVGNIKRLRIRYTPSSAMYTQLHLKNPNVQFLSVEPKA